MDIEGWRRRIDAIDRKLVRLLNRRSRCAREIGRLKRRLRASVHQPERERVILGNVLRANKGPLDEAAIRRLFQSIMDEARAIGERAYRETQPAKNKGKRTERA